MKFELLKENNHPSEQQENSLAYYLISYNIAYYIICLIRLLISP